MFVEDYMKPPNKVITESNLDFIFNLDDESMIVSEFCSMYTSICFFLFKISLLTRHFEITAKDLKYFNIHFCNELTFRYGIIKTLPMKPSFDMIYDLLFLLVVYTFNRLCYKCFS